MHGRQSCVAGGDAVAALGLEMSEKRQQMLRREVGKIECHHGPPMMGGEESQQQRDCITIAEQGMAADATDLR